MKISYIAPFERACRRTITMLFAPFHMGTWMVLGFTAWLARLGQGFFSSNIRIDDLTQPASSEEAQLFDQLQSAFSDHFILSMTILCSLAIVIILVAAFITWITSRGRFMFLDNVMQNRALVAKPWREFVDLSRSLFLWRFIFGLLWCALSILILSVPVLTAAPHMAEAMDNPAALWNVPMAISLAIAVPLSCLVSIVCIYVSIFLDHFIEPIMYKHDVSTTLAWGFFIPLLKQHLWNFFLYGLFLLLLTVPLMILLIILILASCCVLGLLLSIPYVGAVMLLPVYVFLRMFSVEFLGQFSPDVNLTVEPPELPYVEGELASYDDE